MKKTLTCILALCSCLTLANELTTTTVTTKDNQGAYYGWTAKLTDTFLTTTGGTLTDYTSVYLTSVVLGQATNGQNASTVKLAIYEWPGQDNPSVNGMGAFVALSTNASACTSGNTPANAGYTFDFNYVALSPTQQYRFLFVNENTTVADLNVATDDLYTAYSQKAAQARIALINQAVPTGDGIYNNVSLNSWQGSGLNVGVTTYTTQTTVPEPATATLSLLALAGLAARRRRK